MTGHQLNQYLAFGFVPELPAADPLSLLKDWSRPPRRSGRALSETALVREGVLALRAAFEECARISGGGGDQVVFLSGGLDSRAILASLLAVYSPKEIVAATFGAPGEQDFDFAAEVARAAGVRHTVLESFSVDWTTHGLVDSILAREIPLPHPFGQRYLSYRLHQQIGIGNTFWDGLCGDVTGGIATRADDDEVDWETVSAWFRDAHVLPDWERYTSPGFRPESALPTGPIPGGELLTYRDQLVFAVRQTRWTSTRLLRDYTVRTPFLSRPWVDFMLSVPVEHRTERRLYMTVLRKAYPNLFTLPTTTFDGAGVPSSPRMRNAVTLRRRAVRKAQRTMRPSNSKPDSGANNAIRRSHRERVHILELIRENLDDLAGRGVVPGFDSHATVAAIRERRISDTRIGVLLGVELNLKARDQLASSSGQGRS